MEKREKWFFAGITVLVILFVAALMSVRSEKLTWDMLPDYQGEEMEAYVYLTAYDSEVTVCVSTYYDDRDVRPVLFNENQFFKGVTQVVGDESDSGVSGHEPDELVMNRYWNSSSSLYGCYSADEEQMKELQNYLLDFDYQFALVDQTTGKYAYKLKDKLNLRILDIRYKTED